MRILLKRISLFLRQFWWLILAIQLLLTIVILFRLLSTNNNGWQLLRDGLSMMVSIATIGGIVIALIQFQWTNRKFQLELENKRFDYSKQALDYYVEMIVPLLDYDLTVFDDRITSQLIAINRNNNHINQSIIELTIISDLLINDTSSEMLVFKSNQTALITCLSRFSGYFYYKKINDKQVLSIVSYRIL